MKYEDFILPFLYCSGCEKPLGRDVEVTTMRIFVSPCKECQPKKGWAEWCKKYQGFLWYTLFMGGTLIELKLTYNPFDKMVAIMFTGLVVYVADKVFNK